MSKLHKGKVRPAATALFTLFFATLFFITISFFALSPAFAQNNATLSGQVWLDRDGFGEPDADEPGLAGITIDLLDPLDVVLATVVTNSGGNYSFSGLTSGDHTLRIDASSLPAGLVQTMDPDMSWDGETSLTLGVDDFREGLDFGYQGTGSIGGRIYYDYDADGVQDPGEDGFFGVDLTITLAGQTPITVTTFTSGFYFADGLPAGTYTVVVDATAIPDLNPASDLDGMADHQTTITLAAGEDREDVAFGYNGDGLLGDRLFLDLDGDGVAGAGEPGLVGVTAELLGEFGQFLSSTASTAGGQYQFAALPEGTYTVRIDTSTLPTGVSPTGDYDGGLDDEATYFLTVGEVFHDLDFGYAGSASVGDLIFLDLDADGLQSPSEDGLPGVTLTLTDLTTGEVASTTTDSLGLYELGGLPASSWTLRVDPATLPTGANPVSDPDGLLDNQTDVTTSTGVLLTDLDFGYNGNGSIGDRLFLDVDADGSQSPADTGLDNVSVELLDPSGTPLATTTSNADGDYSFGNLLPGDYTVRVIDSTLPTGATQSVDPDGFLDHETTVTLGDGETYTDADFGYISDGSIRVRIWEDLDGNGADDGEPPMPGIGVALEDEFGGNIDFGFTDSLGELHFLGLQAGEYRLVVDEFSLPNNYTQTFDSDGLTTPHTIEISLATGEDLTGSAFAYIGPGSISAFIWEDLDGNALHDGEPPMSGIGVALENEFGGNVDFGFTDSTGTITFPGLLAGNYRLVVDETSLPNNYTQTFDSDGLTSPHTIEVLIIAGEDLTGSAFAYIGPGSISAFVWEDLNGNGLNESEPPLSGVGVRLENYFGGNVDFGFTDGTGTITFENLLAGSYRLVVDETTLPQGLLPTFDSDGLTSPHTIEVVLGTGQVLTDSNFGYGSEASEALLVVFDATALNSSDVAVLSRLANAGYEVIVMSQGTVQSSDADDKGLVLVSSSVTSSQVNSKFRDVAIPVVIWEPFIFDDMKMTGPQAHIDYGSRDGQTQIVIPDASHPLAAGLSGRIDVTSVADRVIWGRPAATATIIATTVPNADRAAIFAYEAGDAMVGLTAPARRVGFFFSDNLPVTASAEAWALFDAAVCWAVNCTGNPIARFSATPTSGPAPLTVTVDASSSRDGSAPIVSYDWDFGDGTTASGITAGHTYVTEQFFTVTLTVTDSEGRSSTATTTITSGTPPGALLVAASTALGPDDAAVRDRLMSLGYSVTVVDQTASQSSDADGKAVVVITSTVQSSSVNTKFRDVSVPVVTWEAWLYDDMKMTGLGTNVSYGRLDDQGSIAIVDPAHPLAAGTSGHVSIVPGLTYLRWGYPSFAAEIVAVAENDPTKALIFAYDTGTTMVGMTAPARRVGLPFADENPSSFTAEGWALFDAAITWATGP